MKAFTNAPSTWEHRKIYPRENTSDTASTRSTCVEIMYSTADSAILVVFRGSLLLYYTLLVEYCCTSSISGICTAGTAKYWQYFVRLVLRVLVLRVLRVHIVPKYFQFAQYAGSMKYISTIYLCTTVSITSSAFYCRQHSLFTNGPTNGS